MTKKLLVAALSATILTTGVAEAKPKARTGVVVHKSFRASGFVWANAKGRLTQSHRARAAGFGRHVAFRARGMSVGAKASTAKVRGAVTFVDAAARTFTLSGNGASILVHLADDAQALPAVGDEVLIVADLAGSTATQLEGRIVTVGGDQAQSVELEGVVLAIDDASRTLTLSADDSRESGEMIAVSVPAAFDLATFAVGDSVELLATLNDDGQTFTLVAVDDHNCGDGRREDRDHGDDDGLGHDVGDDHGDDDGDDHGHHRGGDDRRGSNSGPGRR